MSMGILFLLGKYPGDGGVEMVTTCLANRFVSEGKRVAIVSFFQSDERGIDGLDKSVNLYKLDCPIVTNANIRRLQSILKTEGINIIINQWCLPYYATRLCRKAMQGHPNCKLLAVHHNAPNMNARIENCNVKLSKECAFLPRLSAKLCLKLTKIVTGVSLRMVYHYSDRYIVLSDSFRPIFRKITGLKRTPRLITLSNPVTLIDEDFQYSFLNKQKEILYVGRIDYNQKKTFRLLDVWHLLETRFPDWSLRIVGEGPDLPNLRAYAEKLKVSRVFFEGFQKPLEYYKRASLLLLTSEYEGFGLVIVEGMGLGVVPVVNGSYSAVYDIIDPLSGTIVDASHGFDKKAMAEALACYMSDEGRLQQSALNAMENVKRYSMDTMSNLWNNLFESLIKELPTC